MTKQAVEQQAENVSIDNEYRSKHKLYQVIDMTINAYLNCVKSHNEEWENKHYVRLTELNDMLPHGSGNDIKEYLSQLFYDCLMEVI